jgi:predicted nucleic acid-binding Zn ribbon protein
MFHLFEPHTRSRNYILLFVIYEMIVLSVLVGAVLTLYSLAIRSVISFWVIAPVFVFGFIQAIESLVLIRYARRQHPRLSLNYLESFTLWAFVLSSDDCDDQHLAHLKRNLRTAWLLFLAPIPILVIVIYFIR